MDLNWVLISRLVAFEPTIVSEALNIRPKAPICTGGWRNLETKSKWVGRETVPTRRVRVVHETILQTHSQEKSQLKIQQLAQK